MVRRARELPPRGSPGPGLFDAPEPAGAVAPPAPEAEPPPLSVAELTRRIQGSLEGMGTLRVEGELSGLKRASSGHVYFDLKGDGARLACAIWKTRVPRALSFRPEEGMQVVARGRLDVYAPRGGYSLIVDSLEQRGLGALLAELERLKAELRALGWFERARPLPRLPRRIGVVTSRDGAALRDFLRTRSLRWPGYPLLLCHAAVQGPGAARELAEAIGCLDRSGVDVIVVCRGGGSLEDLWSFNERAVLEAIHAAGVPVVSGVGHESDTTLADLVADHRAHTPTDAAQLVVPDRAELAARLHEAGLDLRTAFDRLWQGRCEGLERLARRPVLRDAGWILDQRARALEGARARLAGAVAARRGAAEARLRGLAERLERQSPRARLERWVARLVRAQERARAAGLRLVGERDHRLQRDAARLDAVSPLRVLARGFSLTRKEGEEAPLTSADGVATGERLVTRLARGTLRSRVEAVEPDAGDGPRDARGRAR